MRPGGTERVPGLADVLVDRPDRCWARTARIVVRVQDHQVDVPAHHILCGHESTIGSGASRRASLKAFADGDNLLPGAGEHCGLKRATVKIRVSSGQQRTCR